MPEFEKNLTRGSVAKNLIVFSLPFVLSNFIQSLYGVADMIIIGNFTPVATLNGVTNATQLIILFTNAVIGLSLGGTVLVGQYLGAGNKKELKSTIGTMFTALLIIAVALTAIAPFIAKPLLTLMRVHPESMKDGVIYFITCMSGTVFVFMYNALAGVLRGLGDAKHPMVFVSIAAVTNIVLDLLFIAVFKWGAFGAALATIISQAFSVILSAVYLVKHNFVFDFKLSSFKIHTDKLKLMFKIGLPTLINNVSVSVSFVFLTSIANIINPVAGGGIVGVVGRYNGFAILPAIGMSSSISAMVAQNFGAGDLERVKKTHRIGTLIAMSVTLVVFALTMLFPAQILKVFGGDDEFIALGKGYITMFAFDYITVPLQFCFSGLFIGTGHTMFSLISGMASSILFRIPACYLLGITFGLGLKGLGMGAPIASLAATTISLVFYLTGRWKKKTVRVHSEVEPVLE
jgi:putative MATE family efflux protein